MGSILRSCTEKYKELTGVTTLRKAATPFLHERSKPDLEGEVCSAQFEPNPDAAYEELLRYVERGGTADANLSTGASTGAEGRASSSRLEPYVAKILMNVLYAARYARFDLLRAVCML